MMIYNITNKHLVIEIIRLPIKLLSKWYFLEKRVNLKKSLKFIKNVRDFVYKEYQ
jgi:hypothetical protein